MAEEHDPNEEAVAQRASSTIEPVGRIVARDQSSDHVTIWTWRKFFEIGLKYAGITLWKWDLKTGTLDFFSQSTETTDFYSLPSPTTWERIVHADDRDRLLEALDLLKT